MLWGGNDKNCVEARRGLYSGTLWLRRQIGALGWEGKSAHFVGILFSLFSTLLRKVQDCSSTGSFFLINPSAFQLIHLSHCFFKIFFGSYLHITCWQVDQEKDLLCWVFAKIRTWRSGMRLAWGCILIILWLQLGLQALWWSWWSGFFQANQWPIRYGWKLLVSNQSHYWHIRNSRCKKE